MRRLLLIVLAIMLACPVGLAETVVRAVPKDIYERWMEGRFQGYTDIFWENLVYDGSAIDLSVQPMGDADVGATYSPYRSSLGYQDAYEAYIWRNRRTCNTLMWMGMEFCFTEEAPNHDEWASSVFNYTMTGWPLYFSEMYHESGNAIPCDENGFSPFWDGLRYEGKPVDPYEAPPNYDASVDYWAELRPVIGYAWYWSYYFVSERDYYNEIFPEMSWNGIEFNAATAPPGHDYDAELYAIRRNRHARGYLDLWEAYFNNMYYENLNS